MLTDLDAKFLQYSHGFSFARVSRDTDVSNPPCSTIQSLGFRPFRRIARKARVCARFAIAHGPGERLRRRDSPESGKSYPGAILLGPSVRQARGLPMSPRQSNV